MNHADSGDYNVLVQFPENSILKSSTYPNAHTKVKKWIFWFPGNWVNFGIILNDFWSSAIWAIQTQLCTEFKNSKNPGIQPRHFKPRTIFKYLGSLGPNILKFGLPSKWTYLFKKWPGLDFILIDVADSWWTWDIACCAFWLPFIWTWTWLTAPRRRIKTENWRL